MARVALLCWECGGGRGHIVTLAAIARRLRSRGWSCILALPSFTASHSDLRAEDMEAIEVARWGDGVDATTRRTTSSASMVDILAQIGLQSAERVHRQLSLWHRLLAEHAPDVVIADFAPGVILAARGRIPCLAVGTGYAVPPPGMTRFPLLHTVTPAIYDENAIREVVNDVLATLGTAPLDRLVQALSGDAQAVCTLPLLDPYAEYRIEPVLGPLLADPIATRAPGASEVFCYLREANNVNRLGTIAASLGDLPARVVAYLPGLAPEQREGLRRRGVDVLDAPAPMTAQLARSRLVVHFGGHGIAASALLAGVPQVVLNFDVEKWLVGRALADRGVALRFSYLDADPEEIHFGIRQALSDAGMTAAAHHAAAEHEIYRDRDVLGEIVSACESLAA